MIIRGRIRGISNYSGDALIRIDSDYDSAIENSIVTVRVELSEQQKRAYTLGREVEVELRLTKKTRKRNK